MSATTNQRRGTRERAGGRIARGRRIEDSRTNADDEQIQKELCGKSENDTGKDSSPCNLVQCCRQGRVESICDIAGSSVGGKFRHGLNSSEFPSA